MNIIKTAKQTRIASLSSMDIRTMSQPVADHDQSGANQLIKLDKSKFDETIKVPYIELDKKNANSVLMYLKPYLFKAIKMSPVSNGHGIDTGENDDKLQVILNPDKVSTINDLSTEARNRLTKFGYDQELKHKQIKLNYENLTADQVFKKLLPFDAEENLSSFSTIGHIIHLNLREHLLPFKSVIGQVLLDKHSPRIKLIVNKLDSIDTEFRYFAMETLAHLPDTDSNNTIVTVSHSKCTFKFDFSKVYWNPRLDTEHCRIIERLRPGVDILYDVFAGVGPFSIPCGKRKNIVLANDLNPECFKWMTENVKNNKVGNYVKLFNQDGRDFIRTSVKDHILDQWTKFNSGDECNVRQFHIAMNLPALAVDFLDSFVNWFDETESQKILAMKCVQLPAVHCYTFMKKDINHGRLKNDLINRIESVINYKLSDMDIEEIKMVRNVSPGKEMYRISFKMPIDVMVSKSCNKKIKLDSKVI